MLTLLDEANQEGLYIGDIRVNLHVTYFYACSDVTDLRQAILPGFGRGAFLKKPEAQSDF
jgi:hypothetical protein